MHDAARFARELNRLAPALDGALVGRLATWLALAAQYAGSFNLTGFHGPEELCRELVLESLHLLELGEIKSQWRAADLGSGVGAPVLPLALACPQAQFIAVEAGDKRAAFLRLAAVRLKLANFELCHARAEELARQQPQSFNLVTSRAFAPPAKLLPLAAQLLAPAGELRGYLGADHAELDAAARDAGFVAEAVRPYEHAGARRHVYRLRRA